MLSGNQNITVQKPRTPLGSYPLGKLVVDIKERLRDFGAQGTPPSLLATFYNDACNLFFLAKLTGRAEYKDTFVLPIIRSVSSNGAAGGGYDNNTHILTLPQGNSNLITWTNTDSFDIRWLNAILTLTDTNSNITYHGKVINFIETVNGFTRVEIVTTGGAIPAITAANLAVFGNTSETVEDDNLDLTDYNNFTQIYEIEKIMSTTAGLSVGPPKIDSEAFEGIKSTIKSTYVVNGVTKYMSNYATQMIHNRVGQVMQFALGGKLTSYGVRTFYVILFPKAMVNDDDLMDVQDIYKSDIDNIVLIKAIANLPREQQKTPAPADIMQWYNDLEKEAKARQTSKGSS